MKLHVSYNKGESSMNSTHKILLLLLALCIFSAESADPLGQFCNSDTSIKSGSTISANIDRLLSALISKTSSDGFTATSYGEGQDKVFGLAQCRGDVSSTDCTSCIQDAAKQIRQRCPNEADARICFIGDLDTSFGIFYFNVANVTDPETFNKDLGALMDEVRKEAVEPKNEGLGKGETKVSPFVTVYALVQCTRDLAPLDCAQCLAIAVGNFDTFCSNRKGCRVLYSSCYVRYEIYPFFFPLNSNNNMADTLMAIVYP
ncbi:hypothetical protein FH972_010361 [Carpinus fangiana]|uniref:Gnk2-homologous domain-containing protein n=1 Tax=Carpinus fangiana TaxID=176857 RepID=A0A660KPS1_9ROSI|nr:hypothetical protein FH972_010361 [Carpinus fangiana]